MLRLTLSFSCRWLAFSWLSFFLFASSACAEDRTIAQILSPETVQTTQGDILRLVGIKAPTEEELADKTKTALQELLFQKTVDVDSYGKDRNHATLASIALPDGKGLQEKLLNEGLVFVYPTEEAEPLIPSFLDAEKTARNAGKGIWALDAYKDIPAENAKPIGDHYAFVVGTVTDVSERRDKTYLNFGEDWKTDFSVRLSPDAARGLKKRKAAPKTLIGRKVRVRGLIENTNGPLLYIAQPLALETSP